MYQTISDIFRSVSNGNPKNKAIWVDGGIHAREWISPASVTYILNNLVENWEDQPNYIRDINWYDDQNKSYSVNVFIKKYFSCASKVLSAGGQSRWLRIFAYERSAVA